MTWHNRLEIPARTPTLNVWQRWHWRERNKYKKALTAEVGWLVVSWPKAAVKRYVVITRRYATNQADKDNIAGGCKPLVDALVKGGVLVDDSPRWCEIEYKQEQGNGMVVEVEERP